MPSSPAPRTAVPYPAFVATLPSMAGKTVAITGCTSGTGLVLARTCGNLGARVVMLNRPSPRADSALKALTGQGIDAVHVPCDLQSFAASSHDRGTRAPSALDRRWGASAAG